MKKSLIFFWILVMAFVQPGFAQGDHKKKARRDSLRHDSTMLSLQGAGHSRTSVDSRHMDQVASMAPMPAPLASYPTYHPMVVHMPIMLLMMAALLQLIVLFRPSAPLNWLTLGIAVAGTAGAYVAGTLVHPHTDGLSDAAQLALETHEIYADYTLWLGLAGTLLKGVSLWRPATWLEGITAVALLGAGIAVGLAGHQGGALTYLYGIGPRGAYLEQHDEGAADGLRHEHKHPEKAE